MKVPVRGYGCVHLVAVVVLVGLVAGGCSAPAPERSVRNPDPLGKIPAFKDAVRERDRGAARQMVKDLDSDDAAIRLFAIEGLERLTGQRLGYRYYDDEHQRRPAIARWQDWLAGKEEKAPQQDAAVARDGAAEAPSGAPDGASGP